MYQLPENMFVLSLRQDHFSNQIIKFVGATPPFLYLIKSDIFSQFSKNDPLRHLRWLLLETRMHRLPERKVLPSLTKDHFSN